MTRQVVAMFLAILVWTPASTTRIQTTRQALPAFTSVPAVAAPQLDALGKRLRMRGQELTILSGEFSDEPERRKAVQIIHQLPNRVVLRGFRNRELKFDGRRHPAELSADESALLETFTSDMPEGMLTALQENAAARLLGRGFKPHAAVAAGYTGPAYDIYEVTAPALGADSPIRKKLYYFDTSSGLLLSTRYDDLSATPTVRVEIRFAEWRNVDGSHHPGRIERYEDGRRVFVFVTTAAQGGPAVDVDNFR